MAEVLSFEAGRDKSLLAIKARFINRLDFTPWTVSHVSQTRVLVTPNTHRIKTPKTKRRALPDGKARRLLRAGGSVVGLEAPVQ